MDVPDIKLVVQWKATCDLCTLWQRYGRAARAPDQQAIAILLVEKKDMDEERLLKAQKVAKRKEKERNDLGIGSGSTSTQKDGKRKAISQLNPPAKRPALTDRTTIINRQEMVHCEDVDDEAALSQTEGVVDGQDTLDLKELRRAHYAKRVIRETEGSSTTLGKKGKGGVVMGSSMDDFINAHVDFHCRRIVPMLVFGNDKRREY